MYAGWNVAITGVPFGPSNHWPRCFEIENFGPRNDFAAGAPRQRIVRGRMISICSSR